MNFIKKKLKGHKKDDEEEEYEKAVYEQSLHPQNPEKNKNTEEWQFFNQLSMKVQDTVQKTQTTLNKLKDTRPEDDEEEGYGLDSDIPKSTPPYSVTKVMRAPPRPPPPSGEKTDLDFGSDFSPRGPPRPPPPGSAETFPLDSSALHGTPSKSYGSPARPPPPSVGKMEHNPVADNYPPVTKATLPALNPTQNTSASYSLLDEFGFKSEPVTSTNAANMQDLLFLDDKEEIDPFDTSYVDVNNIASMPRASELKETSNEKGFNPFSTFTKTDDWMASPPNSDSKKTVTNPFFSGVVEDTKPVSEENTSSFNPFAFNEPISSNEQDDFFGITIEPSSSKDKLTEGFFQKSEELPKPVEMEHPHEFVNSGFCINETEPMDDILDNLPEDQFAVSSTIHRESIKNDLNTWDSDKNDDSSVFKCDQALNSETLDKPIEASMLWGADSHSGDILQPETFAPKEEVIETEDENILSTEGMNVFGSTISNENNSFSNIEQSPVAAEIKLENEIPQTDISQTPTSDAIHSQENEIAVNSGTFSSTSLKGNSCDTTPDAPDSNFPEKIENVPKDEKEEPQKQIVNDFSKPFAEDFSKPFAEDFSKPFAEDFPKSFKNEQNGFSFQVKPEDQKPDPEFDAFAAKFENAKDSQGPDPFDAFTNKRAPPLKKIQENFRAFDSMDEFDPFRVSTRPEEPQRVMQKEPSRDSFEDYDNEVDFSVVIKPKVKDSSDIKVCTMEPPKLLPPPKTPTKAFENSPASRFNPFDKDFLESGEVAKAAETAYETVEVEDEPVPALGEAGVRKADSIESPLSPLFDEDTSQPLEVYPKPYDREGWDMVLRQPNKKKLTGNRFWKKIFVKLSENSVLQLFNKEDDKVPFQELPLQVIFIVFTQKSHLTVTNLHFSK